MQSFAFLLKTYSDDYKLTDRLIQSFSQYNKDNILLYLVAPDEELDLFKGLVSQNIHLIPDSQFEAHTCDDHNFSGNSSLGYRNQSIIKLAFWELRIAHHYMCLDSDAVFIRNFYLSDFMVNSNESYTVLIEDNELQTDDDYYRTYWLGRSIELEKILNFLDCTEKIYLTCHGFQIISSKVMSDFKDEVLEKNGLRYKDILDISAYEFSWYNFFLQKRGYSLSIREPYFKVIHLPNQVLDLVLKNVTVESLARSYIGYVFNSNFYINPTPLGLESKKSYLVAKFLPFSSILSAMLFKILIVTSMFYRNHWKIKKSDRW